MNTNQEFLHNAYRAWCQGSELRSRRLRNKRFTYGDQWSDTFTNIHGAVRSEYEVFLEGGTRPMTNNLIRQMVKTIVGRYRSEFINNQHVDDKNVEGVHQLNQLDELDSRALEEFLISGTAVQRIDVVHDLWQQRVAVSNVNINNFFVNQHNDPLARDCDMVGQLHDMTMAQLLKQVAGGSRSKAAWVRRLYSSDCRGRTLDFAHAIGADAHQGTSFWVPGDASKCRAIEVWTRESREVLLCHDKATAQVWLLPPGARVKNSDSLVTRWDIVTMWHCRWFSPMGDLLAECDSPWAHGSHQIGRAHV